MKLEWRRVENELLNKPHDGEGEGYRPEERAEHLVAVGGRVSHLRESDGVICTIQPNSVVLNRVHDYCILSIAGFKYRNKILLHIIWWCIVVRHVDLKKVS